MFFGTRSYLIFFSLKNNDLLSLKLLPKSFASLLYKQNSGFYQKKSDKDKNFEITMCVSNKNFCITSC